MSDIINEIARKLAAGVTESQMTHQPTPANPASEVGRIARGLSPVQQRVLVHGLSGTATIATYRALRERGLMRVRAADPNPATGGWQRTPLGLAVRAHLLSPARKEESDV
jgi:hypothetical protein